MYTCTIMSVNTNIIDMAKKSVGRPQGVMQDRLIQMRVNEDFLRLVDDWRRQQPDIPQRTEAIRRLVKIAVEKHK